ncbi:MAG: hypothetical protein AB7H90_01045 [Alphaproteobacteria bacterium]
MRQIPYGSEAAAEATLDEFYRQLGQAEARRAAAEAELASLDGSNPDHFDLIDQWAQRCDDAADQCAEIEREIESLEAELWYAFPSRREAA